MDPGRDRGVGQEHTSGFNDGRNGRDPSQFRPTGFVGFCFLAPIVELLGACHRSRAVVQRDRVRFSGTKPNRARALRQAPLRPVQRVQRTPSDDRVSCPGQVNPVQNRTSSERAQKRRRERPDTRIHGVAKTERGGPSLRAKISRPKIFSPRGVSRARLGVSGTHRGRDRSDQGSGQPHVAWSSLYVLRLLVCRQDHRRLVHRLRDQGTLARRERRNALGAGPDGDRQGDRARIGPDSTEARVSRCPRPVPWPSAISD